MVLVISIDQVDNTAMENMAQAYDPRSWPMSWRIAILLNVSVYNMLASIFGTGLSPLFGLFIAQFEIDVDQASRLSTYSLLSLANVWAAQAQSYQSLLATRFVGGLSGGTIEALGPMIVSEIFYEHQLARAMVVYVGFLASGSALGPIIGGGIAFGLQDWTWFFWIMSIAIGIIIITSTLMLPETAFAQDPEQEREKFAMNWTAAEPDRLTILPSNLDPKHPKTDSIGVAHHENKTDELDLGDVPTADSLKSIWKKRSFALQLPTDQPKEKWFIVLIRPLVLLLTPQVLLPTLVFGITIGWTVVIGIIVSNFYLQPPYLWNSRDIGLMNFGPWIGILLGLPAGGALADYLSNRAAKREIAAHDPRSRLPAIIPGFVLSPLGCIIIGVALQQHLHYMVVATGWAMLAFGFTSAANVLLTYAVDSFRIRAGEVGVLINVVKNSIGFGTAYASMDWFYAVGPLKELGTMAAILWGAYLTILPLYFCARPITKLGDRVARMI